MKRQIISINQCMPVKKSIHNQSLRLEQVEPSIVCTRPCCKGTQVGFMSMSLGQASMVGTRHMHMPLVSDTLPSAVGQQFRCQGANSATISSKFISSSRANTATLLHLSRSRFTTGSSRREAVTQSVQKASSSMHVVSVFFS